MKNGWQGVCIAALAFSGMTAASDGEAPAQAEYVPKAVYCAGKPDSLCAQMPGMIGPDPAIEASVGYHGLGRDISGFDKDSQSPFDNMAWQMFVAANWRAGMADQPPSIGLRGDGPVVWSEWKRPSDVFGGETPVCDNPDDLPRISILSKSGGQPDDRMSEFLEASTNQPLIDVAGNWVVFERRLNPVNQDFLERNKLTSLAGQKVFSASHDQVAFPQGGKQADSASGAIEVKSAWRIVNPDEEWADEFYLRTALLEVSTDHVIGGGGPICARVELALIGMHIMQKNPAHGDLKDQWIWATFEHVHNAPLSSDPADPTDWRSYGKYARSECPVSGEGLAAEGYSLFNAECTECTVNAPPDRGDDARFFWKPEPPYAGRYLTDGRYGTQVVQCAESYYLTEALNQQWRHALKEVGSVFANYTLIGTQWGATLEPLPGEFWRNAVPDFLSNTTMETYLQAEKFKFDESGNMIQGPGSCIGCHGSAGLAYPPDPKKSRLSSDFSFLPGLAQRTCDDFDAGPIWDNQDAERKCPSLCTGLELDWNGQWTTVETGAQSVCGCCLASDDL